MDFTQLPAQPFTLGNVTVPGWALDQKDAYVRADLGISNGLINSTAYSPKGASAIETGGDSVGERVDLKGALVLPAFVDSHTHLDKGHILPRAENPDGTFIGALTAVREDHTQWSAEDVRARAAFALRGAYAHGTRAIRTHIDSIGPQCQSSWSVLSDLRDEWAGRIDLQLVSLIPCDYGDNPENQNLISLVAEHAGVLGMVTYPVPDVKRLILEHIEAAGKHGLSLDFHADETLDASSETLRTIAECVLETGFDQPVLVGHCCSLSTQPPDRAGDTLDLVAKAALNIVSLPMCNLYLQDRVAAHTPRARGITLVHELKSRGIQVSFASDNTRDPFYAYGDLDMIEVLREATRIAHLDHSDKDWSRAFSSVPAEVCGFSEVSLKPGAPADLVICPARNGYELLARPQSNRIVLRDGIAIDRSLPDYAELDHLFQALS